MFLEGVVVSRTKISNIDFSKVFYDFRLDFQQITDNLFNKTNSVAAKLSGKCNWRLIRFHISSVMAKK